MANDRFKIYSFDLVTTSLEWTDPAVISSFIKIDTVNITVPVVNKNNSPAPILDVEDASEGINQYPTTFISNYTNNEVIYNDLGYLINEWCPFGYLTTLSGYFESTKDDIITVKSIYNTAFPLENEIYTLSRAGIKLALHVPNSNMFLTLTSGYSINTEFNIIDLSNLCSFFIDNTNKYPGMYYQMEGTGYRGQRPSQVRWPGMSLIEFEDGTYGAIFKSVQGLYYPERGRIYVAIFTTDGLRSEEFSYFMKGAAIYDDDDPFSPGGTSEPGGGGGTFDDDSDEIPDSSLPTLSAANTGFTRIYNPTLSQVQAMANYLWTDDDLLQTIWNHIKQFVEDPMDAFIAFNLVPCTVPDGGTSNFKVMYIDTGVSMTVAANQFVDVDCGTVQLDRYYGSALDYTPYTRVGCFLPYIGTVELDTDEVMGATLHVTYRIDIVSGACVAKIAVDGNILYQYSGHCAINIPFTAADFSNYVNAIIQVGKAALIAASGVPIGAAAAAEPAMQLTGQTIAETTVTQRNPATGRQITMGTERTERNYYEMEGTQASFKGLSPTNLANTVGAVMGSKPMIEHSGGFNGNSGYLGVRRPFLVIKRPRMCNPAGYGKLNGYPCMINEKLGNLSGYTQVQQVQLTGLSATNPEQAEILTLLKQGVIL